MNRQLLITLQHLLASILLLVAGVGCSSSKTVIVRGADSYYDGKVMGVPPYYFEGQRQKEQFRLFYRNKYLIVSDKDDFESKILEQAVSHIRSGDYKEAETLLKQLSDRYEAEVANGIGVIRDLEGDKSAAQSFYLKACRLEPSNPYFRENFNGL